MFERFTDRARRVVVLSQEEARALGHNYIGTEHLLLGVIREGEGVGARSLAALEVDSEQVRDRIVEIIGQGSLEEAQSGHIPFTPRSKKVLELSLREALQLGHNYIGTEHILLGLVREGEGVAAQVLKNLGLDLETLRLKIIELIEGEPAERGGPEGLLHERIHAGTSEFLSGPLSISGRLDAIESRLERIESLLQRLAADSTRPPAAEGGGGSRPGGSGAGGPGEGERPEGSGAGGPGVGERPEGSGTGGPGAG